MYRDAAQPVLRCGQCNKPFDKESTLKRHGYYCRSRKSGGLTRVRSCISCAKRKARCDSRRPECARCTVKGIECRYPEGASKDARRDIRHDKDSKAEPYNGTPSSVGNLAGTESLRGESRDGDMVLDTTLILPDLDFSGGRVDELDWNNTDIDIADIMSTRMDAKTTQYYYWDSPSYFNDLVAPQSNQIVRPEHTTLPPIASISGTLDDPPKSLVRRPGKKNGMQTIQNLMLQTLKSYPLMMMRHNTLPPYIHPQSVSLDFEPNYMEPLNNCINLARMAGSDLKGSRKLFWKNVQQECEHMCNESPRWSKWELLAAIQALSIYILIKLEEGETDHNNFDGLMVKAVIVISIQLNKVTCLSKPASYVYDLRTEWKDWIFQESSRRISVIYQVINMLVYFDPASICELPTDLVLAPLPSKKQLWEARDEFAWNALCEQMPGAHTAYGLSASGDLVNLGEWRAYCKDAALLLQHRSANASASHADWQEWCVGMDGLGGLIMLAASLVAQ